VENASELAFLENLTHFNPLVLLPGQRLAAFRSAEIAD